MLDPNIETPKSFREFVTRVGGLNPFKKPLWRVVLADKCLRRSSGLLHKLPTGDVSIFAVDGKGVHYEKPNDHIEAGVFELPRYPVDGWIAERWFPAAVWGTPEEWAAHHSEAGGRLFAEPYPAEGDYFLILGPWEKLPELSDIENAIRMFERGYLNRPTNFNGHFKQLMANEEAAREQRRQKLEDDLNYMRKNELIPVLKGTSLGAQRFRNQLSESIGDRSHLAAVHDS